MYDVIVVGGGPAGLTAAVYALRAGKTVLVIEKGGIGGQIAYSPKVENYPGAPEISGIELADRMTEQAIRLGADILSAAVTDIKTGEDGCKAVCCDDGDCCRGRAVILATGARHRPLGLPREEELLGAGVSFCAVCDGHFCKGADVAVVGGGNSALQDANLLADLCRRVTIIQNLPTFTGEKRLLETLRTKTNVRYCFNTVVTELLGEDSLQGVLTRNVLTGDEERIDLEGLFIAIGLMPATEAFASLVPLSADGYFDADEDCLTPTLGIFVAGDCRRKQIRQLTTACADGSVAALAACAYLDAQ